MTLSYRIPVYQPWLCGNEERYVLDCLRSNWISSKGDYIVAFEERFASFIGIRHAISVCNGTVALHVALAALGIGPGDEVIVPTLTYIAPVNAIVYCGATPVFVDSDPQTWQLDPNHVYRRITPRTKAILAVHLYGHPADMGALTTLAREHGLFLIEDCAEASARTTTLRMLAPSATSRRSRSTAIRPSPPAKGAWSSPTTTCSLSGFADSKGKAWRHTASTGTTSSATTTA